MAETQLTTINNGATNVAIYSQDCETGCVYDKGLNGALISAQLPDNALNNDQITYRWTKQGKWVPQYRTQQPPTAANMTVNFGQVAEKLQKELARPVRTTWIFAIKPECDVNPTQLIVAPDTIPASGGGGALFGSRGAPAEISRPVQYRLERPHYPIAKASFGTDIYAGASPAPATNGTGVVYPDQAANCAGACKDPLGTWYQAHRAAAAAKPYVMYRVNGGNIQQSSITAAANDEQPVGRAVIAGNYLVVAFSVVALNGYYYAPINANGTLGSWTKVTTGFDTSDPIKGVAADGSALTFAIGGTAPVQVRVASVGSAAVAVTTPTAGVMNAIAVYGAAVLRGGDDMVMFLGNDDESITTQPVFTLPAGSAAVAGTTDITAVHMFSETSFEIGLSIGRGFRTTDSGLTWVEIPYNTGDASAIAALVYSADGQNGWLVQNSKLWRTVTRGFGCGSAIIAGWSLDRFIANLGVLTNVSIGIPSDGDAFTQANVIAVSSGTASTFIGQPQYVA